MAKLETDKLSSKLPQSAWSSIYPQAGGYRTVLQWSSTASHAEEEEDIHADIWLSPSETANILRRPLQRSPVSRQNIYHTSDSRYLEILGTSKASII